jgi:hypothetical protein
VGRPVVGEVVGEVGREDEEKCWGEVRMVDDAAAVVVVVVAGGRALVVEHFGTSTVGVLLGGTVALRCNSLE